MLLMFPVLAVAGILGVGIATRSTIEDEVRRCFAAGCFDPAAAATFEPAMLPFINGTRFEGKLNTAAPPAPDSLNVYFATSLLPDRLSSITCNCAYLGSSIIICDNAFFSSFSKVVNFTRESFFGEGTDQIWEEEKGLFEQVNARISFVLASWIIGHEIGHAVRHETANIGRRRTVTEAQELEADIFFAEKLFPIADKKQRQDLYFGITQFIFSIVSTAFTADGNAGGRAVVAPSRDGIHPPWISRALHLGRTMSALDPDVAQNDDFYESLASHVSIEPGGLDVGSLCAFENLREQAAKKLQERTAN